MKLAERLGMTLAELGERMSNAEFELWHADDLLRADECPFCGVEPRDLMEFQVDDVKCPICKHKYGKIKRTDSWQSSEHQVH